MVYEAKLRRLYALNQEITKLEMQNKKEKEEWRALSKKIRSDSQLIYQKIEELRGKI